MSAIQVQIACSRKNLPSATQLRRWARAAMPVDQRNKEIVLRIVNNIESADLNQRFRHKSGPTNVLSFPAPDAFDTLGDIVICAPLVAKEAREQGKKLTAHWAHLVVHGVLHLVGYDHSKNTDAEIMESLEIAILRQLGFANPYL
jgi:probable rRNA maturation factor